MKRTIEIEDDLQERILNCKTELLSDFLQYIQENSIDDFDEYYQSQGAGRMHEIADSSTPIYYYNIDGLYYLYGSEFDEAYESAGIGDGTEDNHKSAAIWCYLSQETSSFMNDLQTWFEDWQENNILNNQQLKKALFITAVEELSVDDISE